MATALDPTQRQAVIDEATARGQRFGITPEQALYNYARENNLSNADVDTYMGFNPGATDAWLRQRDASMAQQPAPQQSAPQVVGYTPAVAPVAAYNNGRSLTADEIREAQQWSAGRSGSEIMAQAKKIGLTPDQLGAVFGASGDQVTKDFGYGSTRGYNGLGADAKYDGSKFVPGAQGVGVGGASSGLGGFPTQQQPSQPQPTSSNLGFSNPYLSAQADAITSQYTKALNQQVLPGIGYGATMAGGYGGSRHGIAQGMAIDSMGQNLSNSLANLYGQNYQQDQNTATQRGGQLFQYNLGLGQLDNSRYGMDQNFYTNNRQLDQSGANLGMNLYNQGTQGNLSQGQGIYNIGSIQQGAPWSVTSNATNNTSPYTGTGVSNLQTQQGSTAANTLGGALAGAQLWNLGFGNNKG